MLRLDAAFEDRILNALAVVFAGLRDAAQTPGARLINRRHVIRNQNQHVSGPQKPPSPEDSGQVMRDVSTQMPRQYSRLRQHQLPDAEFLVEQWMRDRFLFTRLIGCYYSLAPRFGELDR